jgi:hypothetical protein
VSHVDRDRFPNPAERCFEDVGPTAVLHTEQPDYVGLRSAERPREFRFLNPE